MEKIIEYCPYCNDEEEIEETGGICSGCGHFLKPCSLCDMDKVKCSECKIGGKEKWIKNILKC